MVLACDGMGSASNERSIGVHIRASLDDDHDGCGCMIRRGYVNIDTLEPYMLYLERLESVENFVSMLVLLGRLPKGHNKCR